VATHRLEGSRFMAWQLCRFAASGSRERLLVSASHAVFHWRGSRFTAWQLCRLAASGSRERLLVLPWPSVYLVTSPLSGQNIDRPLKRPLIRILDQSITNRIVPHIKPFLIVLITASDLAIPKASLPNGLFVDVRPTE
jgi:hypothetical protein